MTTTEAASYLGYADGSRIRQFVRDGLLTARKRGRDLFVRRADLDALRKKQAAENESGKPGRYWKLGNEKSG